jgi:phosphoglycerate dehydrogenase-like enzyme
MAAAVEAGGGQVVELADAEALVWADPAGTDGLVNVLEEYPDLEWVQLPWAGIENFTDVIDDEREWTCGKGVYAEPVAELALALSLAGLRNIGAYARADRWGRKVGRNLLGARVTVLGGGGITESLLRLLRPFDAHVTVVRNRVMPMDGADVVVQSDQLHDALPAADVVILALALTPETEGIIGATELELMEPHAWLVNVARGKHVETDALVEALSDWQIGGAALDVTEPEPLPEGHRLWTMPNCIITPHAGNTEEMARPLLSERITTNVRRFGAGEPLVGVVFPDLGY